MIELPIISLDLMRAVVQNFTIIVTLVLLYHFIPDTLLSRSKLLFSLCGGVIFSLAAAISIPPLWQTTNAPVFGVNIVLVPLAGFIAGPVSAIFVAGVLLLGSYVSSESLLLSDIPTVIFGILLGCLFYFCKSWNRFPLSYLVQILILGFGVALIEMGASAFSFFLHGSSSPLPGTPPLISILPFFVISWGCTILIGFIIGFIDRKKQAEVELLD